MAIITCGRFLRFLRSILAPASSIVAFGLLLTWMFILYQPNEGPGELQRLGWQAWESVSLTVPSTDSGAEESATEGVDWWNVTSEDKQPDASSLPLDVWSPLLPHVTGLTEITIMKCIFPPTMASLCSPKSTPEQDAIKGKWVRVERDLNKMSGIWSLYIYYRRSRRLDVDLVNDLILLPKDKEPAASGNWRKVTTSIRDGVYNVPPLFLWYSLGERMSYLSSDMKQNLITELDVLFGDDRPWYGFERLTPPTIPGQEGRVDSAWVTYRRGVKTPPRAPPLHFSHDGKFKILQIADLHFSVSQGICREVSFSPCTHSDNLTSTLLSHVIDEEKPDMVIFTGDQLNGQGTSWDPRSVLAKFANTVTDRGIAWAAIFGNHDSENGMSREDQMTLIQAMPYSVAEPGPKEIDGIGNYVVKVHSADASKMHLLTLYFLDSGSYSKGVWDWFGFFHPTEYDWIKESQINWFLQESASIQPIERPFTPDGANDFGDIWKRQTANQVTPSAKKLAKPNAFVFFHIPLPESFANADINPDTGLPLDIGIHDLEEPGNAKHNGGFFENGILQALETDHSAGGGVKEVKVITNGHNHITENCRRVKGVWMCFGGGGSYSGYGKIGFDRRFRVYDISDFGETIRTYKRTETDEILDDFVLAGKGAPPLYETIGDTSIVEADTARLASGQIQQRHAQTHCQAFSSNFLPDDVSREPYTPFIVISPPETCEANDGLQMYLRKPEGAVTRQGHVNSAIGEGATINSTFTILYGKVTFEMKAPAVAGSVSAVILVSDQHDEIDVEVIGGDPKHWQTNVYAPSPKDTQPLWGVFGEIEDVPSPSMITAYHNYTIDWNEDRIIWSIDGHTVRTLTPAQTRINGTEHYPTQASRIQLGIWDASSPEGTSEWAKGPINWETAPSPIIATVKSVRVECD
ncbi:hypothetical protein EW145_g1812 [Phellinidium pouzarii]|uniref:GH16 domain-containing protein n=1 Tax=Phellinidium pouzarii TaxID=167371 RepID=A0A4V3XDH5_9AGAM|nr:hypothetical protein EW145_g1812 [Phellinidium pouzarii]